VTWYQSSSEVWLDGSSTTVGHLAQSGLDRFSDAARSTVAVVSSDQARLLAAVLAAPALQMRVLISTPERYTPAIADKVAAEVDFVDSGSGVEPVGHVTPHEPAEAGLLLLTSGTTGPPKLIQHDYESINTYGGVEITPNRWICMYEPGTYAWYQVVMLTFVVPDQSLVIPASTSIHDGYRALHEGAVSAVPSTPSMWRYLQATIPQEELAALALDRISLGGERADQPLLDALTRIYPDATITHLFASTETGAAIVVGDGRAGFPATWLDTPLHHGRVRLRVEGGTLWVKSPYGHIDTNGWIDTGDAVEVTGDRVQFIGRAGERTINVGGAAVAATTLEDLVAAHPGVIWVRAYGKPDRFVGNLVALDVVVDRAVYADETAAERDIVALCRDRLPPIYEPRWVKFLERPDLGPNQKSVVASPQQETNE